MLPEQNYMSPMANPSSFKTNFVLEWPAESLSSDCFGGFFGFCTPLHLGHNSVLISQEVLLICPKYFYFSISRSISFPSFIFYFIIGTCIFLLSILKYVNKYLEINSFILRDRDHNIYTVKKTNNQMKGYLEFWQIYVHFYKVSLWFSVIVNFKYKRF